MKLSDIKQVVLRQPGIRKLGETLGEALSEPYLGTFEVADRAQVQSSNVKVEVATLSEESFDRLRAAPDVASIAPAMPVTLIHPLGDKRAVAAADAPSVAWGVQAVKADVSPYTGAGVVVAVLDTGIDITHPAFTGMSNIVQQDFTGEGNGDGNGHGTHCAGTIFGQDVDGCRIGIARGVQQVLIGKVLDRDGGGSTDGIMQGLTWAINSGVHVISMSLGFSFPDYIQYLENQGIPRPAATSLGLEAYRANIRLFDAIVKLMNAQDRPIVLVAASGNESNKDGSRGAPPYVIFTSPPAAADGAVSVGALDESRTVAPFSNTKPSLVAPGVDVLSAAVGGGLTAMTGTSMAAPHVAGVAALYADMLLQNGNFTLSTFTANLIGGAERGPLTSPFDPLDVGAGLVQAPA